MRTRTLISLVVLSLSSMVDPVVAEPVGSALTYQGQLKSDDKPVNGTVDFVFALYDAPSDGTRIDERPRPAADVVNGLFTVELDFPADVFNGQALWLAVEVRNPAWDGQGVAPPFTALEPRQHVTAVPYAVHAQHGGNCDGHSLDAADGDPVDAVYVDEEGNVGIGTTSPEGMLHVKDGDVRIENGGLRLVGAANYLGKLYIAKPIVGKDDSVCESHIYARGTDNGYGLAIGVLNDPAGSFMQTMVNDQPAFGGSSIPLLLNANGGNVGIGTTNPAARLHVSGGPDWTMNGWRKSLALDQSGALQLGRGNPQTYGLGVSANTLYFWNTNTEGTDDTSNYFLTVLPNRNIGIGTTSPAATLHVDTSSTGEVRLSKPNAGGQVLRMDGGGGTTNQAIELDRSPSDRLHIGSYFGQYQIVGNAAKPMVFGTNSRASDLTLATNGNVGIGTTDPQAELDVRGEILATSSNPVEGTITAEVTHQHGLDDGIVSTTPGNLNMNAPYIGSLFKAKFAEGASGYAFTTIQGGDSQTENIKASITSAGSAYFAGTTRTAVVQITGADVAERFPTTEDLQPGMVVTMDAARLGHIRLARTPYSKLVAGIVSGANDLSAGAVLGNLPGHEDAPPIALAGRVYCWCDADANGPIEPGDMLTTSSTPGHAMCASDSARAFGSVIGKAMGHLDSGQGLVLVLVNLQ